MTTSTVRWTQEELLAELRKRFGDDWHNWAFVCPACKDVATGADFEKALLDQRRVDTNGRPAVERYLGQECIGRVLGALKGAHEEWKGRGCDWCAFGLFRGPDLVVFPDGHEAGSFKIADAPNG
jgi:hypothetical protein